MAKKRGRSNRKSEMNEFYITDNEGTKGMMDNMK